MEHRGYAIEQYRPEHRDGVVETLSPLLLNLSCTRASLPGYLKLGFAPISEKACLSSYRLAGLFRFLVKSKKQYPISLAGVGPGWPHDNYIFFSFSWGFSWGRARLASR